MQIGVIGVSDECCSLSLREKISRHLEKILKKQLLFSASSVILSTCRRTEIYFTAENLTQFSYEILAHFEQVLTLEERKSFYVHLGKESFYHLARVTSGLDSAIVGESEIQSQVKMAYESARKEKALSSELHYAFQKALRIGKKLRSEFLLDANAFFIEKNLYSLFQSKVSSKKRASVLFVGNSQMNRKLIGYFSCRGDFDLYLASRHPDQKLEKRYEGLKLFAWDRLDTWECFSAVVTATKDVDFVISKKANRAKSKVIIVDLGIPRNVNPILKFEEGVDLLHLQDVCFNLKGEGVFSSRVSEDAMALSSKELKESVSKYCMLFDLKTKRKADFLEMDRMAKTLN